MDFQKLFKKKSKKMIDLIEVLLHRSKFFRYIEYTYTCIHVRVNCDHTCLYICSELDHTIRTNFFIKNFYHLMWQYNSIHFLTHSRVIKFIVKRVLLPHVIWKKIFSKKFDSSSVTPINFSTIMSQFSHYLSYKLSEEKYQQIQYI